MVKLKRAYQPAEASDGFRVLVDRLWPRGVSREAARLGLWAKELAPSPELRKWFGHRPERFRAFAARYRRELAREEARALLEEVARRSARGTVTLVYGARDEAHNGAVVLKDALEAGPGREEGARR